ncbi:hypothetical protein [Candidatus Frankia alpina]|uniref:hypothetical protein n=1 Tax=Candidatus Frankia alpina TaxID=2699483 RepID=UPI002E25D2CD
MVLLVAVAGELVADGAQPAGRAGVQHQPVHTPFDERLRDGGSHGDPGVPGPPRPAGGAHGGESPHAAEQHRRAGMGEEPADGSRQRPDLRRAAMRPWPVEPDEQCRGGQPCHAIASRQ